MYNKSTYYTSVIAQHCDSQGHFYFSWLARWPQDIVVVTVGTVSGRNTFLGPFLNDAGKRFIFCGNYKHIATLSTDTAVPTHTGSFILKYIVMLFDSLGHSITTVACLNKQSQRVYECTSHMFSRSFPLFRIA